ncbi:MAG: FeoB-associated Cys-rich membrane protein [Bacteroidales bacterium]|nr:FeoB-associated Cys-rich membrane protein [Bacteroidales bacterium]
MNVASYIVLAVVLGLAVAVICRLVNNRRKGIGSCGGTCGGCSLRQQCGKRD